MRTQKKVGSKVTDYYYDSNNNLIAEKIDSATLFFYYDTENNPVALSYNGKMFYYVKNLQGDIVKILDEDGQEKADYVYNACLLYTSPSPRDSIGSRMPSSA